MKMDNIRPNSTSRLAKPADNTSQRSHQADKEHFDKQLNKKNKQANRKSNSEEQPNTPSSLPDPFMLAASIKQTTPTNTQVLSVKGVSEYLKQLLSEHSVSRPLSNQNSMQITLNNIQFNISLTNNQVHIVFAAADKQQQDLIKQALPSLHEKLTDRFNQVSVELGLSSETSSHQGARPDYIPEQEDQT